ncbi:MAG: hypothetical protein GY796_24635 [Chloroflexi bacterium]|nr:hypothetical protein [Chloroflexota bacterium]
MKRNQYNKDRSAQFTSVKTAVAALRLPPIDQRKLISIMNAIEVQLESGNDSPKANDYLLCALQAAVLHEVSDGRETAVVQAIDAFAKSAL